MAFLDSLDEDTIIIDVVSKDTEAKDIVKNYNAHLERFYIEELPYVLHDIWIDRKSGCKITPGAVAQFTEYYLNECIKEIILYGNDLPLAKRYAEIYECLDFGPISFMADEVSDNDKNVYLIDEIIYKEDYLVLLYEEDEKNLFEKLYSLGVKKRRCGKAVPWHSPNFNTRNPLLDVHMGYTFNMNSKYPGIYVYGNQQSNDFIIAVLGGSTTDSMLDSHVCPWVEIMFRKYCVKNITIFNGGVSGYYSGQELIKLKRDMLKLNPDLCIVYDGYNDLMQGILHKRFKYLEDMVNFAGEHISDTIGKPYEKQAAWTGIPSKNNPIDDWLENIECMYAISESRGIKFFSFMQPMLFTKKKLDDHSKTILQTMLFHGDNQCFMKIANQFRDKAEKITNSHSYIYNLTDIFDDDDVYVDIAHVYDNGNEIVADHIWNIIKDSIK